MANEEKPKDAGQTEVGGTSSSGGSRAGQFLNGPITQNCSPESAGYRCATQTPGCEPTGFTGQCTKQPEVGGAWPCITALPMCSAEPTGFTGKCTDQPWPNPTCYFGCTYLHCPTNDLTHQPQICHMIEAGMRNAAGTGGGGGEAAKGAAEGGGGGEGALPPTRIPGCGYTQTWGLCETRLLGCGFTKQWGPNCPPTNLPGCGFTKQWGWQCPPQTNIPGCGFTQQWGPKCPPSVANPCITQTETPGCRPGGGEVAANAAMQPTYPNGDCTFFGCWETRVGCQSVQNPCIPPTEFPGCGAEPMAAAAPGGGGAAAGGGFQITLLTIRPWQCAPTPATRCFWCPPKSPLPWFCPPSPFICTPPISIGIACTIVQCGPGGGGASAIDACPTRICGGGGGGGGALAAAAPQQTMATTCTQFGQQCQSAVDACPTRICTYPNGDCTFFGCGPGGGGGGGQTAATVCTQFGQQCRSAVDACPTRLCGGGGGGALAAAAPAAGRAGGIGVTAWLDCTQFGWHCGQFFTQFAVQCNVIDPWVTRVGSCTLLPPQCPPPPPPTGDCPSFGGGWCPPPQTPVCQTHHLLCTQVVPQCGGGGTIVQRENTFFPCTRDCPVIATQPRWLCNVPW